MLGMYPEIIGRASELFDNAELHRLKNTSVPFQGPGAGPHADFIIFYIDHFPVFHQVKADAAVLAPDIAKDKTYFLHVLLEETHA